MSLTRLALRFAAPAPKVEAFDRYLFIGPHPDDIEVGAGATAAKLVAAGKQVCFLICTDGRYGLEHAPKGTTPEALIELRKAEAVASAKLLGVDENNPFAVYSKGLKPLCDLYVQTDETGLAESYEQATARIPVALERIAKEAYARGGGDVLAVTSGMIAMTYFFDVLKIPRTESGGMGNLSTTILRYDGKTLSVDFPIGRMDFLAEE